MQASLMDDSQQLAVDLRKAQQLSGQALRDLQEGLQENEDKLQQGLLLIEQEYEQKQQQRQPYLQQQLQTISVEEDVMDLDPHRPSASQVASSSSSSSSHMPTPSLPQAAGQHTDNKRCGICASQNSDCWQKITHILPW